MCCCLSSLPEIMDLLFLLHPYLSQVAETMIWIKTGRRSVFPPSWACRAVLSLWLPFFAPRIIKKLFRLKHLRSRQRAVHMKMTVFMHISGDNCDMKIPLCRFTRMNTQPGRELEHNSSQILWIPSSRLSSLHETHSIPHTHLAIPAQCDLTQISQILEILVQTLIFQTILSPSHARILIFLIPH